MACLKRVVPVAIIVISLPIFLFLLFSMIAHPLGLEILKGDHYEKLAFSTRGNLLVALTGLVPLLAIISLYILWRRDEYWRDLRYKMAFYLYHSRVKKGDIIPLFHLAEVAVSRVHDVTGTLIVMIRKGELRGRVNENRGTYTHIGMTRKGVKLVQALPPMKKKQLNDVRRFALKDARTVLRENEASSVPARKGSPGADERKYVCSECGRRNRGNTQFCTYCGEVLE